MYGNVQGIWEDGGRDSFETTGRDGRQRMTGLHDGLQTRGDGWVFGREREIG